MFSNSTRTLLLVALGHLTIELCNNFLPVVFPVLIETLGLSYAQIGTVIFVAGISTSLTQPLFGYLSDRWQPHLVTILSIVWSGVVMTLTGFAWGHLSLMLIVGLGALGSAAFHPSGVTIASTVATARRGAAVSIFSVGGNIGAALSPLWVSVGIGWLGMRGTSILIPIALLTSLFLYRWLEPVQRSEEAVTAAKQVVAKQESAKGLVLIVLAMMFRAWFQTSLITYLPTWMQTQGQSLTTGGHMLFVFLMSVGVGSLIGGALSDRIGRWQVLVVSLSLLGPVEWLFLSTSHHLQIGFLSIMGILLGSTFPVSIVLAQEAWSRGLGVASGVVMGLPWVGGGIGASLTGFLADHFSLTMGLRSLVLPAGLSAISILIFAVFQHHQNRTSNRSSAR